MLLIDYAKQVVDKEKIKAIVQLNRLKITKVPNQGKSKFDFNPIYTILHQFPHKKSIF